MRSCSNLLRVALLALPLVCLPATARAATISLGLLSFDQLIAADPENFLFNGTDAFNIFNFTGDFASPFDPGVPSNPITPISLNDANLFLTRADGGSVNVAIGAIAPGLLTDDTGFPLFALQFADTDAFVSAVFTATLSVQDFLFADGSTFHAATPELRYTLATTAGRLLANPLAPSDPSAPLTAIAFELNGEIVPPPPAPVPEPGTIVLLGVGCGLTATCRALRRTARTPR